MNRLPRSRQLLIINKTIPVTAHVSNESHVELRACEEFLGNETEEAFRQMVKDGLHVRMGIRAFGPDGKQIFMTDLRPVFILEECVRQQIVIN